MLLFITQVRSVLQRHAHYALTENRVVRAVLARGDKQWMTWPAATCAWSSPEQIAASFGRLGAADCYHAATSSGVLSMVRILGTLSQAPLMKWVHVDGDLGDARGIAAKRGDVFGNNATTPASSSSVTNTTRSRRYRQAARCSDGRAGPRSHRSRPVQLSTCRRAPWKTRRRAGSSLPARRREWKPGTARGNRPAMHRLLLRREQRLGQPLCSCARSRSQAPAEQTRLGRGAHQHPVLRHVFRPDRGGLEQCSSPSGLVWLAGVAEQEPKACDGSG